MPKKYRVTLTAEERDELERLLSRGKADVRCLKHAQMLLKADEADGGPGWSDARIADAFDAGVATIERLRQRFVEEGLQAALRTYRTGTRLYERKLDGAQEAHLIALACSAPPNGRARRTDWAGFIRFLLEGRYQEAEKLVLIMDQLNTHSPASLYEAFPPAEAQRLAERIEIHHTPKHGSWLNMAEIELSALARQCLARRIARQDTLKRQIAAWQEQRNAAAPQITWQFTTQDARVKLRSLYPSLQP